MAEGVSAAIGHECPLLVKSGRYCDGGGAETYPPLICPNMPSAALFQSAMTAPIFPKASIPDIISAEGSPGKPYGFSFSLAASPAAFNFASDASDPLKVKPRQIALQPIPDALRLLPVQPVSAKLGGDAAGRVNAAGKARNAYGE